MRVVALSAATAAERSAAAKSTNLTAVAPFRACDEGRRVTAPQPVLVNMENRYRDWRWCSGMAAPPSSSRARK